MTSSSDAAAPLPTLQRVDLICDAFEREWRAGRRPEIPPFVAQAAERDREEVTAELVRMDVEYRRNAGESPVAEDYVALFSDRESAATIFAPRAGAKQEPPPPEFIGPYQLLECLGRGGMGAVYKALHPKLEKLVAIKILRASRLHDAELQTRFQREMKAVGKLDHPHLIRAMDAGEVNDLQYLVMEYVAGADLGAVLKQRGPLPIGDACELIRQAALGLHAAHSLGIVHRDIKPANLILAPSTFGPPVVKVLDLGLALLADSRTEQGLTSASQVMGTIEFMAPEQAGACHKVDHRADIYSLGATLYALLTGRSPLDAAPDSSLMQKLTALATVPVPPIRKLRPSVNPELAGIVHKMLAADPTQRYSSMTDVATALARFTAGANLEALVTAPSATTTDAAPTLAPRFNSTLTEATTHAAHRPASRRIGLIVAAVAFSVVVVVVGVYLANRKTAPVVEEPTPAVPRNPEPASIASKPASPEAFRRAVDWLLSVGPNVRVEVADAENGRIGLQPGQSPPPGYSRINYVHLFGPGLERFKDDFADQLAEHLAGTRLSGLELDYDGISPAELNKLPRLPPLAELQMIVFRGETLNDSNCAPLFSAFAQIPSLTSVGVNGGSVTGEALELPRNVRSLSLLAPSVSLKGLQRLERLPQLQYLHLSGPCTEDRAAFIATLRLQSLDLSYTEFNDDRAARIGGMQTLTFLNVNGNPLTDKGLAKLQGLTALTTLKVTGTQVTAEGVAEFQRGLPDCEVVWDGGVAPRAGPDAVRDGIQRLLALGPQISLEAVDANGVARVLKPGDALPAKIARVNYVFAMGPEVERLNDDFPAQFAACLPDIRLRGVSFAGGGMSPAGMTNFLRLPQLSELDWIGISGGKVADAHLAALSALRKLRLVELASTAVRGESFEFPPNTAAVTLVDCSAFSAQGVERLGRLPHLESFNLHASPCTAEQSAAIANMRVSKLFLGATEFGDDRAEQLRGMRALTDLNLHRNPLTDRGLLEFKGLVNLTLLTVTETQVTGAGVAELQKSLPNCVIDWDGKK